MDNVTYPHSLETQEIIVTEREYDEVGRCTKETITVTKPRALPFNPNQTAPWNPQPYTTPPSGPYTAPYNPHRWPEITYTC